MSGPVLDVRNLSVSYETVRGVVQAVRRLSLSIGVGETVGLIGESGSGKSSVAYAIMRYLPPNGRIRGGQIWFEGVNLVAAPQHVVRSLWGRRMAMVYQNPATSLNPSYPVGEQVAEGLRIHQRLGRAEAWIRAAEWLGRVGLPDPRQLMRRYPHQLSGGELQRVLIAMAFSCRPALLLLDEPTAALDTTTAAGILDLLERLVAETGTAALFIAHHLGTVARIAQRVVVMYAGEVMETGPAEIVLRDPWHPYTRSLVAAVPTPLSAPHGRLTTLPGQLPDLRVLPPGCIFQSRCPFVVDICRAGIIPMEQIGERTVACIRARETYRQPLPVEQTPPRSDRAQAPLLDVRMLRVTYAGRKSLGDLAPWRRSSMVRAVDGVTIGVREAETVGLVGESGCGKSTLARALVGLEEFEGEIRLGTIVVRRRGEVPAAYRRDVQIVLQHPDASLNPRHRIRWILERPLRLYGLARDRRDMERRVRDLLRMVRLPDHYLNRYPHELSGGEKQRVAIARAFAGEPRLVICDEVTSGLDVSVQAAIVNLLLDLQARSGTSLLFISHDLGLVRAIADRVAVMYLGRIVEIGSADQVYGPPFHPYTEALLAAAPISDPDVVARAVRLSGPLPSSGQTPGGCRFHTRCHRKLGPVCEEFDPPLTLQEPGHEIACVIPPEDLRALPPIWRRTMSPSVDPSDSDRADEGRRTIQ
jgi:peptide/nickel transport system ATP-binding protein